MHGYFLSLKLYDAARIIANPFVYDDHREKLAKEKMEKMAETRIRAKKDSGVKVNKKLAEKTSLRADPRFSRLFDDPDFAIDENSREFALLNPSVHAQKLNGKSKGKTVVEEEEEESDKLSSDGLGREESEPSSGEDDGSDSSDAGGASTGFF
jgi:ribosome biogenesis protein ENP2